METTHKTTNSAKDTRTPSPPFGYSRVCTHSKEEQIHIVAEFHAHKIRPSRIAYRIGIDIALIEELIAGEAEEGRFSRLVAHYRKQRYSRRMKDSKVKKGVGQYELQQTILREFEQEVEL
ncbi:MAG: membrane-bound lytic murein transglycosylase B [Halioglobus sp.]|jgi:membrane-bound lytic murein transglycosylase B